MNMNTLITGNIDILPLIQAQKVFDFLLVFATEFNRFINLLKKL